MKIGFYVQRVASAPGFENVVSAHVQLPLFTMQLLREQGHEVELITTKFGNGLTLPSCLPKGVKVHQVTYGINQGDSLVMFVGNKSGIRPLKFLKQLWQIRKIVRQEEYDILHFSGSSRVAYLAGMLNYIGINTPIVLTINVGGFSDRFVFLRNLLWKNISSTVTSTSFFQDVCESKYIKATVLKHGIIRQINANPESVGTQSKSAHKRVLFWRDPSWENGTDLCLKVYSLLAPQFPDVSFDLAVRPHWNPVPGLRELSEKFSNIHLHEFPYNKGITIEQLLSSATCVLLPFRQLSTHPQFAVMESMLAGTATITTALESNLELIEHERNGYLVPLNDIDETAKIITYLLNHVDIALKIGQQAHEDISRMWNWNSYTSELVRIYENCI